jgi:spore germination protein YaaH
MHCRPAAEAAFPSPRIVLGLGIYGYDWDWAGGNGRSATWDEVHTLATMHGITSQVASIGQSPHFSYTSDGTRHEVWYEDVRSITAKLDLARRYGVGVFLWRLGGQDPALWPAIRARTKPTNGAHP